MERDKFIADMFEHNILGRMTDTAQSCGMFKRFCEVVSTASVV